MTAALLVLAWGNPGRGDDGLGPALLHELEHDPQVQRWVEAGWLDLACDYQLQVEHAVDLSGRRAALLVDATADAAWAPFRALPLIATRDASISTHALSPQALLQVAIDLDLRLPPCTLLGIAGSRFELGEGLSEVARAHLQAARGWVRAWLQERVGSA